MKISKALLASSKREYKHTNAGLPLSAAVERVAFTEVFNEARGVRPVGWRPERVPAASFRSLRVCDWHQRALAVRIVNNDVAGFALGESFDLREVLRTDDDMVEFDAFRAVWPMLRAAAINDRDVANAFADRRDYPAKGEHCFALLANAVWCCLKGDLKKAGTYAGKQDKGSASYNRETLGLAFTCALCQAIAGAAARDPQKVALGLGKAMIEGPHPQYQSNPFLGDLRYEVQGVARLLYDLAPETLELFDLEQQEFWDAELWRWSLKKRPDLSSVNLRNLSHELHEQLIELKEPVQPREIDVAKVPPPYSITPELWNAFRKRDEYTAEEYGLARQARETLWRARKLPFDMMDPATQFIDGRFAKEVESRRKSIEAQTIVGATWYGAPAARPRRFWAIKRVGKVVVVFPDPKRDKQDSHASKHRSVEEAVAHAALQIKKRRSEGYVELKNVEPGSKRDPVKPRSVKQPKVKRPRSIAAGIFDGKSFEKWAAKKLQAKGEWQNENAAIRKGKAKSLKKLASKLNTSDKKSSKATNTKAVPRRFEFVEGKSSKFWEIVRVGKQVKTIWGRIGTDGQSTSKSFKSEADATNEYESLIASKTKKGYVKV